MDLLGSFPFYIDISCMEVVGVFEENLVIGINNCVEAFKKMNRQYQECIDKVAGKKKLWKLLEEDKQSDKKRVKNTVINEKERLSALKTSSMA